MPERKILVINSGSTSIKIAVFVERECVLKSNEHVPTEITAGSLLVTDQLPARMQIMEQFLKDNSIDMSEFSIISSRGGPVPMCESGAYKVDKYVVDLLTYAPRTQHASALSALMGAQLAEKYALPHIIYDGVSTDDMMPIAKYTGYPGIYTNSGGHALNTRMVARTVAERMGKKFEDCNFIVAHLGGGCSISTVHGGKIIDYTNDFRGCITPERCGLLPNHDLIELCYSGKYTKQELQKLMLGGGGFILYVGTSDAREVEKMADAGDETAQLMFDMMSYNLAKNIGQQAPVLGGNIDRIIFTGGLSNSKKLLDPVIEKIKFIAPVEVIPGEMEMEALAYGALRVLDGEEPAKDFRIPPTGYDSIEAFYKALK